MNAMETLQYTSFLSAVEPPSLWKRLRSWWSKGAKDVAAAPASDPAKYSPCNPEERLNAYKKLLEDARTIYVFRNGTAVYSSGAMSEAEAESLMAKHGRLQVGTESADFYVASIESPVRGFAVKYAHPQIVSYADFPISISNLAAGSLIRLSRVMDSYDLNVVARYVKER